MQPRKKSNKFGILEIQSIRFQVSKSKLCHAGATPGLHGVQIKYLEFLEFKGSTYDSV